MLTLNTLTFLSVNANIAILNPLMSNFYNVMVLTPFFFGMMFALWGDKIPIDDRLADGGAGGSRSSPTSSPPAGTSTASSSSSTC